MRRHVARCAWGEALLCAGRRSDARKPFLAAPDLGLTVGDPAAAAVFLAAVRGPRP